MWQAIPTDRAAGERHAVVAAGGHGDPGVAAGLGVDGLRERDAVLLGSRGTVPLELQPELAEAERALELASPEQERLPDVRVERVGDIGGGRRGDAHPLEQRTDGAGKCDEPPLAT